MLFRSWKSLDLLESLGIRPVKVNTVMMRGINDNEIEAFAELARTRPFIVRFIEFMPLDAEHRWATHDVISGEEIRKTLESEFGPLIPVSRNDPSQPAFDYQYADGIARVGLINPVSQPFCQDCNRLRITADGHVRNCLFSTVEWDVRQLMRGGATDEAIEQLVIWSHAVRGDSLFARTLVNRVPQLAGHGLESRKGLAARAVFAEHACE